MANNYLDKTATFFPKNASKYIDKDNLELPDVNNNNNNSKIFISVKHVQFNYQCFSDWSKTEMKNFWEFNKKIHETTWTKIYNTARKSNKSGFGYTVIKINKYPNCEFKKLLSPDINIFEMFQRILAFQFLCYFLSFSSFSYSKPR